MSGRKRTSEECWKSGHWDRKAKGGGYVWSSQVSWRYDAGQKRPSLGKTSSEMGDDLPTSVLLSGRKKGLNLIYWKYGWKPGNSGGISSSHFLKSVFSDLRLRRLTQCVCFSHGGTREIRVPWKVFKYSLAWWSLAAAMACGRIWVQGQLGLTSNSPVWVVVWDVVSKSATTETENTKTKTPNQSL